MVCPPPQISLSQQTPKWVWPCQHVGRLLRVRALPVGSREPREVCFQRKRASYLLFIHPVATARALCSQHCPGLAPAPQTPHPALPASPRPLTPTCPCGRQHLHGWGAIRGHWGRLSRWCVEGAGDGTGCPAGPCAAGEMPRPCSSATKSKQGLTSGARSGDSAPGLSAEARHLPSPSAPDTLSGLSAPLWAVTGEGVAPHLLTYPV